MDPISDLNFGLVKTTNDPDLDDKRFFVNGVYDHISFPNLSRFSESSVPMSALNIIKRFSNQNIAKCLYLYAISYFENSGYSSMPELISLANAEGKATEYNIEKFNKSLAECMAKVSNTYPGTYSKVNTFFRSICAEISKEKPVAPKPKAVLPPIDQLKLPTLPSLYKNTPQQTPQQLPKSIVDNKPKYVVGNFMDDAEESYGSYSYGDEYYSDDEEEPKSALPPPPSVVNGMNMVNNKNGGSQFKQQMNISGLHSPEGLSSPGVISQSLGLPPQSLGLPPQPPGTLLPSLPMLPGINGGLNINGLQSLTSKPSGLTSPNSANSFNNRSVVTSPALIPKITSFGTSITLTDSNMKSTISSGRVTPLDNIEQKKESAKKEEKEELQEITEDTLKKNYFAGVFGILSVTLAAVGLILGAVSLALVMATPTEIDSVVVSKPNIKFTAYEEGKWTNYKDYENEGIGVKCDYPDAWKDAVKDKAKSCSLVYRNIVDDTWAEFYGENGANNNDGILFLKNLEDGLNTFQFKFNCSPSTETTFITSEVTTKAIKVDTLSPRLNIIEPALEISKGAVNFDATNGYKSGLYLPVVINKQARVECCNFSSDGSRVVCDFQENEEYTIVVTNKAGSESKFKVKLSNPDTKTTPTAVNYIDTIRDINNEPGNWISSASIDGELMRSSKNRKLSSGVNIMQVVQYTDDKSINFVQKAFSESEGDSFIRTGKKDSINGKIEWTDWKISIDSKPSKQKTPSFTMTINKDDESKQESSKNSTFNQGKAQLMDLNIKGKQNDNWTEVIESEKLGPNNQLADLLQNEEGLIEVQQLANGDIRVQYVTELGIPYLKYYRFSKDNGMTWSMWAQI